MSLYVALEGVVIGSLVPETKEFVSTAIKRRIKKWFAVELELLDGSRPETIVRLSNKKSEKEEALGDWMGDPKCLQFESFQGLLQTSAPCSYLFPFEGENTHDQLLLNDYCTQLTARSRQIPVCNDLL